jgi:hypothetical protein
MGYQFAEKRNSIDTTYNLELNAINELGQLAILTRDKA